jgi:hypothetical protein
MKHIQYANYQRNHAIVPGSEQALYDFLNSELEPGVRHKWRVACYSTSEDALTWSCFDVLRHQPQERLTRAFDEIMEDAFGGQPAFSFADERELSVHIGKRYDATATPTPGSTETDAAIETAGKLVFVEAKLYSSISLPDSRSPYDQIIRKLRVGFDVAHATSREFYFIFLDLAPLDRLRECGAKKAMSAQYFTKYQKDAALLDSQLAGIPHPEAATVQARMGWLTWACLFKTVLRAVV